MSISNKLTELATNKLATKAAIEELLPSILPGNDLSSWPNSIRSAVILKGETKTINPSTSQQVVVPSDGKNGITQVTINPVTSSIDANITAGNIKSGVSILGVTGAFPSGNINITTTSQTDVSAYATAQVVDANLLASNIKKDVVILGITGSFEGSGGGGGLVGYDLSYAYEDDGNSSVTCYKSDGTTQTITSTGFGNTVTASDVVYVGFTLGAESTYIVNNNIAYSAGSCYSQSGTVFMHLLGNTTISKSDLCLLKGTLITLADNSEKPVEDITFDDELLVWDFDNGCFSSAKPIWIKKPEEVSYQFLNKYKSGKMLKTTGKSDTGWGHRSFDLNKNKFLYTTESVSDNIFTLDGVDTHMSCERIEQTCESYNIITERHFNLFANRILTSCSLNNLYPIENMRYIKDNRTLRSISDYDGVQQRWFDGLRLSENTSDINKLNKYVKNLMEKNNA